MFYFANTIFILGFFSFLFFLVSQWKYQFNYLYFNILVLFFFIGFLTILYSSFYIFNDVVFTLYFFNSSYYVIGIDKLSIIFLSLTFLLFGLCFIYNIKNMLIKRNVWLYSLISIFLGLVITFIAQDLILFFIGFEFVLIPLFWIVMEFGSRTNKIFAAYFMVIITLFGSCFFLIAFFIIFIETSFLSFNSLSAAIMYISESRQTLVWFLLFLGLVVKVPLIPLHLWLPEAHGEAPTVGSVLLAGIVLKLGTYGMIRCLVFIFSNVEVFFSSILIVFGLLNITFAAIISLRQLDMKKAVAYGSVAHMGIVVAGLSEVFYISEFGSVLIIVFHGVVSPLLFFLVGSLYDRFGTRNYYYYGSLALYSPILAIQWFFAVLGNIAFPGTGSFTGEIAIIISVMFMNPVVGLILIFCTFVNLMWNFVLITRVVFMHSKPWVITFFYDISLKEFVVFTILNVISVLSGLFAYELASFFEYSFYYL